MFYLCEQNGSNYILFIYGIVQSKIKLMNRLNVISYISVIRFGCSTWKCTLKWATRKPNQKNRIDMFDALQVLQSQTRIQPDSQLQSGVPFYSYLVNIKALKINEYEVLYSKNGIKTSQIGRQEIREVNNPVGLFNVSNCCYLNSLLQCYFLMGSMTREILQAEPIGSLPQAPESRVKNKRIQNEYKLLSALQQTFARMKLSSKKYLDPTPILKNLVDSVGEKIEYGDEKDLHQINMCIVQRLSQCLMFTRKYYSSCDDSPSKARKNENIKKLFYGKKVEYTEGSQQAIEVDFLGLIVNPKENNLLSGIDSQFNYEVQIDGQNKKRETYIKSLPEYLFININRTGYEKSANQFVKNQQKMSFDFVIYLDRYLDKNKEKSKLVNPKIVELLKRKNMINHQINHLQLLATKLDQCRKHAKYLSGWDNKLPEPKQLHQQKQMYLHQIANIQKQLVEIQSRHQKFVLMYLFVHRGDAISGHYWGYGRNGNNWYRFDINCAKIKQSDILIDMERSGGTPYAMVYVRDNQIQSFDYPYHLAPPNQQLLDIEHNKADYLQFIPTEISKKIIDQNITLHKIAQKDTNKAIVEGVVQQYKVKYNVIVSQAQQFQASQSKIPNYQNFTLFLHSVGEKDFMKFHIFEMCLHDKAKINTQELLKKDKLLKSLQKSMRKKMKGKMVLRHYAIECEPEEGKKYKQYQKQYKIGKICVNFIEKIHSMMNKWPKSRQMAKIIDTIIPIITEQEPSIYIKSLARQLVAIILLDLAVAKEPLKQKWVEQSNKKNPLLSQQLQQMRANICNQPLEGDSNNTKEDEFFWKLEDLTKNESGKVVKKIQEIIKKMEKGFDIHTKNTKGKQIVKNKQGEDLI